MWRFYDRPMPGSIYRLPDDRTLQRGITYTFLPDGKRIRVPAMNRMQVHAESQGHQEGEDDDIMQKLTRLLSGKKDPHRKPIRVPGQRTGEPDHVGAGLRPVNVQEM
jgi:hypothetical protein